MSNDRRHETAEKIANRAEYFLKKFSQKSNRVVGKMAQVSYETVRRRRQKLEAEGEIPRHERREEVGGRMQKVERTTDTGVSVEPTEAPELEPAGVELPSFKPSDDYKRLGVALDTFARPRRGRKHRRMIYAESTPCTATPATPAASSSNTLNDERNVV